MSTAEKDAPCTCAFYVVDYSDPERHHPENVDREPDAECPFHGPSDRAQHPGAEPSRTVETTCNWPRCNSPRTGKCFAWCKCRCHSDRVIPPGEGAAS